MARFGFRMAFLLLSDLSEISRVEGGGGGNYKFGFGNEVIHPCNIMGVKFANPPLELGLQYHDPPPVT